MKRKIHIPRRGAPISPAQVPTAHYTHLRGNAELHRHKNTPNTRSTIKRTLVVVMASNNKGSVQHVEGAVGHDVTTEKVDTVGTVLAGQMHDMSLEDRAAALRLAQQADPGLEPFSWRMFTFTLIVLVCCMCSGDNGTCNFRLLVMSIRGCDLCCAHVMD
jgi:hypothetical protein